MNVHSTYLDRDLVFSERLVMSGGEEIAILPQNELEDIILNDPICVERGVQTHYTCLLANEPGHYAFLCAVYDGHGRRVERIGESTLNTLDTSIAQNYPTLMAFKRSFGAAAISFLGLRREDGKALYTDQQIREDTNGSDYGAMPSEEPATAPAKPAAEKSTSKKTSKKAAEKAPFSAVPTDDVPPAASAPVPASVPTSAPADEPDDDDMFGPISEPSASDNPFGAMPMDIDEPEPASAPAEETPEADVPETAGPDEFDTTILQVGKLKNRQLSIRAAFNADPSSVRWVANELTARNELQTQQQAICRAFLEKYDKEG